MKTLMMLLMMLLPIPALAQVTGPCAELSKEVLALETATTELAATFRVIDDQYQYYQYMLYLGRLIVDQFPQDERTLQIYHDYQYDVSTYWYYTWRPAKIAWLESADKLAAKNRLLDECFEANHD